jgi:nitrogen-specific signal transduction histidine kinase
MRDRDTSRARVPDDDPLESLIEAIAAEVDRLNELLDKVADEAFIETEQDGHRVRLRVHDRFGREQEVSRPGQTEDEPD